MSVTGKGPRPVKITSERVRERPLLRAGRWVEGLLLLFDLGYHRYQWFACIVLYLTNVPPEKLRPRDVAATYAAAGRSSWRRVRVAFRI